MHQQWLTMAFLAVTIASCKKPGRLHDGGIIFHRSTSRQAMAIVAPTYSVYTHIGLIFLDHRKPWGGEPA